MGKETKEKGKHRGKKITQFPTQSDVQEELEDAAMDRFLRQSIIEDADRIERAVEAVLASGLRTGDIMSEGCRKVSCSEMGDAVRDALK